MAPSHDRESSARLRAPRRGYARLVPPRRSSPAARRIRDAVALTALTLVGPGIVAAGAPFVLADLALEREGVRVVGTVESFRDAARASQRDVEVSYRLADGVERRTTTHAGYHQRPEVGAPVAVIVDPLDPERAIVPELQSSGDALTAIGVLTSIVAVPTGVLGLVALRNTSREERAMRERMRDWTA